MTVLSEWWGKRKGEKPLRQTLLTQFGKAKVYSLFDETGDEVRVLNVGGVLQSATYLDERWARCPFAYLRSFDRMFQAQPNLQIERVLMIGGAGFSYPKQLLTTHPELKLDVVEVDPAMIEIARSYFFLDRLEEILASEGRSNALQIFAEDGEMFLKRISNQKQSQNLPQECREQSKTSEHDQEHDHSYEASQSSGTDKPQPNNDSMGYYDAIINDAFVREEPVSFFMEDEGIAQVKACLSSGGLYLTNCVVEYTGNAMNRLYSYVQRLRDQFCEVAVIDASDERFGGADNYLVIATDGHYEFTDVIPYED